MLLIFIIVSIVAILLSRGMKFRERITEFSKGAGQKDLLLMVWIFVLAGAFAASAKAMGAVDAKAPANTNIHTISSKSF